MISKRLGPNERVTAIPIDQLEDDDAWKKVEKAKRRTVLRQERDALAKKVRHSLGKVSTAASPFKRK